MEKAQETQWGRVGWKEKPNSIELGKDPRSLNFLHGAQCLPGPDLTPLPIGPVPSSALHQRSLGCVGKEGGGTEAGFSGRGYSGAPDHPWQGWRGCLRPSCGENPGGWCPVCRELRDSEPGPEAGGAVGAQGGSERSCLSLTTQSWDTHSAPLSNR